jgi:hypothetical protein
VKRGELVVRAREFGARVRAARIRDVLALDERDAERAGAGLQRIVGRAQLRLDVGGQRPAVLGGVGPEQKRLPRQIE